MLKDALNEEITEEMRVNAKLRYELIEVAYDIKNSVDALIVNLVKPPSGFWWCHCDACGKRYMKLPIVHFGEVDTYPLHCAECYSQEEQILIRPFTQEELDEVDNNIAECNRRSSEAAKKRWEEQEEEKRIRLERYGFVKGETG